LSPPSRLAVITKKTRILDVVYNASNNELVRTKTLVKNCIVQIDSTPFRTWFENHYHVKVAGKKGDEGVVEAAADDKKQSDHLQRKIAERKKEASELDPRIAEQFATGRVLACLSSRPGQSGRADGYLLEGPELDFYQKQLQKKKSK
jgi:small subunit ribosomal protein S8e